MQLGLATAISANYVVRSHYTWRRKSEMARRLLKSHFLTTNNYLTLSHMTWVHSSVTFPRHLGDNTMLSSKSARGVSPSTQSLRLIVVWRKHQQILFPVTACLNRIPTAGRAIISFIGNHVLTKRGQISEKQRGKLVRPLSVASEVNATLTVWWCGSPDKFSPIGFIYKFGPF
jgi:putative flippase GtrA